VRWEKWTECDDLDKGDRDERSRCPQGEVDPVPDAEVEADVAACDETELDVSCSTCPLWRM